ncbi:amidase family protein [Yanghanlia caeni]|uniref:Amidase family protein n=1 Tax=Yanghanlia caeni TaxID=3064283 RepID=A0ABU1D552_9BURK|nr:amidase family protein [Alcaligenaceae bacterium LG-2]
MHRQSFKDLRQGYLNLAFSPVDIARSALAHAAQVNEKLNAFSWLDEAGALEAAHASAQRWRSGETLGPLDGMPITVKDSAAVKGWPLRRGSLTTPETPAPHDTPFVARLRAAGAVLLGKTRAPEFNWKGVTDSPGFGITRNPLDPTLTPGGSSGGCAAAVAAGVVRVSIGSDAAGSVRIPAAFTGVLGLKPTRGRIPLVPFPTQFSGLAHLGPLAASADDLADVLDVIAGAAAGDWTSSLGNARPLALRGCEPEKLRVGVVAPDSLGDMDPVVRRGLDDMVARLAEGGIACTTVELDVPGASAAAAKLYRLGCARTIAGLGEDARQQLDPGLTGYVAAAEALDLDAYLQVLAVRDRFAAQLYALYESVDTVLLPTLPILPFEAGRNVPAGWEGDDWLVWNPYTPAFNLVPDPVLNYSVWPANTVLPTGVQFVAPPLEEGRLLALAAWLEARR